MFKDKIAPVIGGKTDDLEKAKAIYAYIKKAIKWNEIDDFGSGDGIRTALDNHTGNAAEVNLSLAAALKAAGLNAEAVLLSTRENGFVNKLYPVIKNFKVGSQLFTACGPDVIEAINKKGAREKE